MNILILDNGDAFPYALFQTVGELLQDYTDDYILDVYRNDEITLKQLRRRKYDRILIASGPPFYTDSTDFGVTRDIVTKVGLSTPILGVGLGMHAIASLFGASVLTVEGSLPAVKSILHDGRGVYRDVPQHVQVMQYSSLRVDPVSIPETLMASAIVASQRTTIVTEIREIPYRKKRFESVNPSMMSRKSFPGDMQIMGIRHTRYPIEGVQFRPESIATEAGTRMIANFLFHPLHTTRART